MNAKRALVASHYPPEFDRDSGSRRLLNLIELLRADDWTVTFLAARSLSEARYTRALQQLGVAVFDGSKTCFEDLARAAQFDLALLAFWRVAEIYTPMIRRVSPQTRVMVDSVDLHFVRNARRLLAKSTVSGAGGALDSIYGSELVRELNVYASADAVLTVSEKEAGLINDLIPESGIARPVPDIEDLMESSVPMGQRRGIVFVGSFRHGPNVGAVEFLCKQVVPQLDPEFTSRHPVYILGESLDDTVRRFGEGLPNVRMVGWVPSVQPYLEQARLSVIPVRYGAGTKRKLLQTLMAGTPAVSTNIGVEGFGLRHEEHVLVADEPADFATAISRLLSDDDLWRKLSRQGRAQVLAEHGRPAAQVRLRSAIEAVMARSPKPAVAPAPSAACQPASMDMHQYSRLRSEVRQIANSCLPPEAKVMVVSHGDSELLKLNGRTAWHFPQNADGQYAGHHPTDSAEAIALLKAQSDQGGKYLLIPATMLWWLRHYSGLAEWLALHARPLYQHSDLCAIYELHEAEESAPKVIPMVPAPQTAVAQWTREQIEAVRPPALASGRSPAGSSEVLVLGIYMAAKPNAVEDIVAILDGARHYKVTQKWLALGGGPPSLRVAEVTVDIIDHKVPKFELLNRLLAQEDLNRYEFVVLLDDDNILPHGFLDAYLELQSKLGYAIAQPARTSNSFIDHPIVEKQAGVAARRTLFVEIGPVVSFHRSVFPKIFPFDLCSPMGWGYSNAWATLALREGFKMGIIDKVPVDHSLRPTLVNYDRKTAESQRAAFFQKQESLPTEQCYRILDVTIEEQGHLLGQPTSAPVDSPRISVILPTLNRADLLSGSLQSLVGQTLGKEHFEVIVIDDGSTDATPEVCHKYALRMPLRYYRIQHSGIAAAKNLGIFLAHAPVVFFFDDDDVADPDLLLQHVQTHQAYPQENRAVLGYTTWSPQIPLTPVMEYVTDIGQILFAYRKLQHGQLLDHSYMWGGRSSCKRSLLVFHGVHNQQFLNMQDVELGCRLARFGLKVVFNRQAISYMVRAITFDEFCRRSVKQGRSQYLLSRLHQDPVAQAVCRLVPQAERLWREMEPHWEARIQRVHELETLWGEQNPKGQDSPLLQELRSHYEWTFKACKLKGIVEAQRSDSAQPPVRLESAGNAPKPSLIAAA